ncbi:MAG: 23S rRNA (uracil(1939)-C(5))-methyltransferase RlmD, partial [Roseburia sp.]|nr:23S rRNA (uracil(1939)-C(5))-methyltransferase RlmD [Roseburia sp.]
MAHSKEKSLCPAAGRCGGCQWIDKDYQEQLKIKETRFRKLMEPYCKTDLILGMKQPAHYRNKVHAAFGEDRKHNIISGIYEEKSHRIVPLDRCHIENEKADEIIVSIRGLMKSFKIRPYNEDTGFGLLRHVLIRIGHVTGQIMVVLVLSSPIMPSKNNFVKALRKLHPEITTIVLNKNDRDTGMVLGDQEQVIYGKGYIEDEICGKRFRISAKSFYQVNPVQAEILYRKAIEYAGLTGRETVVDAYCGTGTIGIIAADKAGRVIGVEANQDAVRDARNNAKRNQTTNIEFFKNDAGKALREMAEQGVPVDLVLMDPPRGGSSEEFLEAAARLAPPGVVYISCNPDTLVRDLKYLTAKGYGVKRAVAVDLFPFTEHTEAVCLLSKLHTKQKIEVEPEMDEMDLTAAESKATYEEIKGYVLEHTGLKVSNLYIAQIKQKCGIIERANYNLPKSENSRQPKCPPEKE